MSEGAAIIRELRMEQSISIRKLSEMVNTNYVFLSRLERGLETASEELIRRIATELGYRGNLDVLVAKFGKVPEEIKKIVLDDPNIVAELPAFFKSRKKTGRE